MMLRESIGAEQVCVLADYQEKPRRSSRYYEREVTALQHEPGFPGEVFGACMLESEASLLIQVVDVLLGAVRYDFQLQRVTDGFGKAAKVELLQSVRDAVGWPTLAATRARRGPRHFSVQELATEGSAEKEK